ncbi:hypothetical protein E4T25_04265 [Photobacterium damselae subsp. piscicida]|uniref:hypothetical protein n=1 Tax=Photobacterium damselae TaxID=38293 RepID=UPI001075FCE1|nr:hypothetical protein [Photobacterium damselae]TFZ62417.1 hypothetical protein E4T25_04265 [Photobacterium damselae subsp. piscicida]
MNNPKNLTQAISALRAQVKARHSRNKESLIAATEQVKAQEPFSSQVQQALIGNTEGKTLSNVTPTWVKQRIQQ